MHYGMYAFVCACHLAHPPNSDTHINRRIGPILSRKGLSVKLGCAALNLLSK